jgi:hypothetical protein
MKLKIKSTYMYKHLFILSVLFMVIKTQAQNVGIGTTNPNASAMLDISSNNKGLLIPRMTSAQRNAIASPAKGLMAFDSSQNSFWYYNGSGWKELSAGTYNGDSSLVVGKQTGTIPSYNLTVNSTSNDSSGYLYDSGGPDGNYGNNENFTYNINRNANSQLATDIIVLSNNLESTYDSLIISDDYGHRYILLGTNSASYRFFGSVHIQFKTNFTNTASGFSIHWNGIYSSGNGNYDPSQTTGWYYNPAKNYMRGGANLYNTWSPTNSGLFSFAYGINNKASGDYSVVFGSYSMADAYSAAIGYGNVASGNNSIALGTLSKASGFVSTSLGYMTSASSLYSTAMGNNSKASGQGSTAMGTSTTASNINSTAMGYSTTASGQITTAMGANSIASGDDATAIGTYATASGTYSTALGFFTTASGYESTAMGTFTTASGNESMAMGTSTTASGNESTVMGYKTKSKSYGGFVTGLFNDSTNAANPSYIDSFNRIFQIGNGTTENSRSNAMTVLQNGNIGIGELNPTVPLNLASSLGNKISLWGNAANYYGMGIQSNLMQFYSASYGDDIAFGYGNSAAFTENVRMKGNGNVGIGTNMPGAMLTVKKDINVDNGDGNAGTTDNTLKFGGNGSGEAIGSNRTTTTNQYGLDFYTFGANRMSITLGGNVGIGTTGPTAKLSVNGTANNATGNWGVFSDERVKTVTGNFTDGLNVIRQINPVVFNYNDNAPFKTSDDQIGIVAQELEKIAPYMVSKQSYNQFADLREVNNQAYVFLLINAVKEQQEQIDKLEKLVKELSKKVN